MNFFLNRVLSRWEEPTTLAAWAFALLYLLESSRFTSFLRPEFGVLLILALLLLVAMLVAHACGEEEASSTRQDSFAAWRLLRLALALLPLACVFLASGQRLGDSDFKKRFASFAGQATEAEPLLVPASPEEALPSAVSAPVPQEAKIIDLIVNPRAFDGSLVAVSGVVARDKEIEAAFGKGSFLLYRFAITCCAADARPVSVVVKPSDAEIPPDGKWLRVEGRLSATPWRHAVLAALEPSKCEAVKAPEDPYAYP